jgi:hypothetical protein
MDLLKLVGGLALAVVGGAVVAIAATTVGLTMDSQLLGSELQAAAAVTGAVFLGALAFFAALGRPWRSWDRTPYW